MINAYASQTHYFDHIAPIWARLADPGVFLMTQTVWRSRGISGGLMGTTAVLPQGEPVLVAGQNDYEAVAPRPVVYMQHGIGQRYSPDLGYAGGVDEQGRINERVIAYLVPNEPAADAYREHHSIPVEVIGSPRLEELSRFIATDRPADAIVMTWHWHGTRWPEQRSALPEYRGVLRDISRALPVLGHGHPRQWGWFVKEYRKAGIEQVRDWPEALSRAHILTCDNSSVLFEAAALDVPVVVVNSQRYRREVEWGLRFWEWSDIGPNAWKPADLLPAIQGLLDRDSFHDRRMAMRDVLFPVIDGAAELAAERVSKVL